MRDNDAKDTKDMYRQRPESSRPKMPRGQRAKQFAPFDALTGLGLKLKEAEEDHRRMLEAKGPVHVTEDLPENLPEEGIE